MYETLTTYLSGLNLNIEYMMLGGIALGVLTIFWGVGSMVADGNPAATRIATSFQQREARRDRALLQAPNDDPHGIWRAFLPTDMRQRTNLSRKLAHAGYHGPNAVRYFTAVRIVLGLLLPGCLLVLLLLARVPGVHLPFDLAYRASQMSQMGIFRTLTVLVAVGYFLPMQWLKSRVQERKQRIEEAFPNALDLMQVSVESGLSFDAAMTRVGHELAEVCPDLAFEFMTVQRQIQAGRDRDSALQDLARRTDVGAIRSFVGVVIQSIQFGTSMSDALTAYAKEMREYREMKAQEMANKLPVKMSAVLASLMLPALILITIGPVIIRYVRFYGG